MKASCSTTGLADWLARKRKIARASSAGTGSVGLDVTIWRTAKASSAAVAAAERDARWRTVRASSAATEAAGPALRLTTERASCEAVRWRGFDGGLGWRRA